MRRKSGCQTRDDGSVRCLRLGRETPARARENTPTTHTSTRTPTGSQPRGRNGEQQGRCGRLHQPRPRSACRPPPSLSLTHPSFSLALPSPCSPWATRAFVLWQALSANELQRALKFAEKSNHLFPSPTAEGTLSPLSLTHTWEERLLSGASGRRPSVARVLKTDTPVAVGGLQVSLP